MSSMLGLTSLGAAAAGGSARGQTDTKESWDQVVAAGKKEGLVVWSFFGAPGAAVERQAREFEKLYGIRIELAPARTGDFEARWNAERAAGKASIDLRSSGSPENRRLGLILLSEPIGPSPGSRWAAYTWKAYGDDHLRKVIDNVKALTRAEIDAPKQIARGEYGIFIHPTQVGAADIWKLPKPHPFRLVVPEDGVMLLFGATSLLKDAPHPNAARLFMNYQLTRSAQQINADDPGGPFIRRDVTPKIPELAHFATAKPFPNNPDTYEFGSKLFFEWSAKAEPYLKAAGLRK
jgi:ABC-type uncharacterized transport system YnjBCD substrate-binding protein